MGKKETVNLLVKGGAATAGPPLGPALAGKGINVGQVVKDINEKTSSMKGMDVPVKVVVDPAEKKYEIIVGLPPAAALLKKEAGVEAGSGASGTKWVGDLKVEHLIKIARVKSDGLLSEDLKKQVKTLLGTCVSLGLKIEGKSPKEARKEIDAGIYDKEIAAGKSELTAEDLQEWESEKAACMDELAAIEKVAAAAAAAAATTAAPAEGTTPAAGGEGKPAEAKEEKKAERKKERRK